MTINDLKSKQAVYHNARFSPLGDVGDIAQFRRNLFHDYFKAIPFKVLERLLLDLEIDLNGKRLLVASCGSGIDIYYLTQFCEPIITVSDISENAVKQTVATFPDMKVEGRVEDTERLSFPDGFFDYAFTASSLHHLPRPFLGLYELLRVSKNGIFIIEPNDSWLTRLFTRLGIATEIEKSGNYVYRISKADVEKVASSLFLSCKIKRVFATHRVATNGLEFTLLRVVHSILNSILSQIGNCIVFYVGKT